MAASSIGPSRSVVAVREVTLGRGSSSTVFFAATQRSTTCYVRAPSVYCLLTLPNLTRIESRNLLSTRRLSSFERGRTRWQSHDRVVCHLSISGNTAYLSFGERSRRAINNGTPFILELHTIRKIVRLTVLRVECCGVQAAQAKREL